MQERAFMKHQSPGTPVSSRADRNDDLLQANIQALQGSGKSGGVEISSDAALNVVFNQRVVILRDLAEFQPHESL